MEEVKNIKKSRLSTNKDKHNVVVVVSNFNLDIKYQKEPKTRP